MPPITLDLPPQLLLAKLSPPPAIVQMLQRDEGLSLKLYRDTSGNWSIGHGRNLAARGITKTEALLLLENDILACQDELDEYLVWWRKLSDLRQMAMLSLCFNLGVHGLLKFRVALKALEAGQYRDAARGFRDSKWARQVGDRARRITHLIEHNRAPSRK